ncbi:MAG: CDP-alcohol phosphatidyltransferase family protein [Caldilineaceae bacterium]
MQDAYLRRQKDRLLTPMAGPIFASVHPNSVSIVAMIIGLGSVAAIMLQLYWVALGLWAINRVLDGLDGVIARVHQKQSDFGGFLDLFLDFVIYLTVPIAFIWAMPSTVNLWAGIALLGSYVMNSISWTTLAALLEKRHRQTPTGLPAWRCPPGSLKAPKR